MTSQVKVIDLSSDNDQPFENLNTKENQDLSIVEENTNLQMIPKAEEYSGMIFK